MIDAIFSLWIIVLVLYMITMIGAPFYFKLGWFKKFYHDIMGWCTPDKQAEQWFDGLSVHCTCRHCHKEIMQDSQGNWF